MARTLDGGLANYLKHGRELADLTQAELADKLRYGTAQFISNWERNIASPPVHILKRLIPMLKLDSEVVIKLYLRETEAHLWKNLKKAHSRA